MIFVPLHGTSFGIRSVFELMEVRSMYRSRSEAPSCNTLRAQREKM